MKFYTSVAVLGNNIVHRWVENGIRHTEKVKYQPTFFVSSNNPSKYKTLYGETVELLEQGSIRDAKDFIEQYNNVSGFNIYGDIGFQYQYISDKYFGNIEYDMSMFRVAHLDIETGSEFAFALPSNPTEPVTAITVKIGDVCFSFAYRDNYVPKPGNYFTKCSSEMDLFARFMDFWTNDYPDIISGWNIEFYDVPYLINRMTRQMGEMFTRKISPWGFYRDQTVNTGSGGREQQKFTIYGIAQLDYIALYKKFAPRGMSQDSYKLESIAMVELGEGKIPYEGTLHELYINDFQKFMDYNVQDTNLIAKLEDKLGLIELAVIMAYDAHINFEDVFFQTRMWDARIYNELRARDIVIPPRRFHGSDLIAGGFVKDPEPGMFYWLVSFDFSSLYPSLMRLLGVSPENFCGMIQDFKLDMDKLVNMEYDLSKWTDMSQAVAANGALFSKNLGFVPELLEKMLNQRTFWKDQMKVAKKELEKETDPAKRKLINKKIAKFNGYQSSIKVSNNSCYGAFANNGFRYYNANMAEAVTLTGQMCIKFIIKRVNQYLNKLLKTEGHDYVIAADTDSNYLELGPLVDKFFTKEQQKNEPQKVVDFIDKACKQQFQPLIDGYCKEITNYLNGTHGTLDMKRESIADKAFWTAKKKYAMNVYDKEGVRYAEPKIEVTGLEIVRSSTPLVVRQKLRDALKIIMNGTNDQILNFIDDFKKEFKKMSVEEIAFPRGVYDLKKYSDTREIYGPKCPIAVRGALMYNHWIKEKGLQGVHPMIQPSEKIKFVYLRLPNPVHEDVISFPGKMPKEFELSEYVDYNLQFEKTFFNPIENILKSIKWDSEWSNSLF